jgi:hypothetical protein
MNIITRDLINKNIIFIDPNANHRYDFIELSKEIDFFKNLFQQHGADGNCKKSIVIGFRPSKEQTACIFACFELGISVCIIDFDRPDKFKQYKYTDPKSKRLLPIDFFIISHESDSEKFEYFKRICDTTIVTSEIHDRNYAENKTVFSKPDTILMRCTSSGTTGTPKIVEHTHEFMYNLSLRNSVMFNGNVVISQNLNHGSSFATFYLPSLMSSKVSKIYKTHVSKFYTWEIYDQYINDFNHIMFPYKNQLIEFLNKSHSDITLYTLGPISSDLILEKEKFKDIISIFGCNETSGPVFINKISNTNFMPSVYQKIDDFYKIEIKNSTLHVTMPYYENLTIDTKDIFRVIENHFVFVGRNDLIKINGVPVEKDLYDMLINSSKIPNSDFIYDVQENEIYLAVWDSRKNVDKTVEKINQQIKRISKNSHNIKKYAVLDKSEFMSGVKIDNELLRHYFRNY